MAGRGMGNDRRLEIESMTLKLFNAVNSGNLHQVKVFTGLGGDVESVDGNGYTPLMRAVIKNRPDIIKHFLDIRVSTLRETPDYYNCFTLAGKLGKLDIIKCFVDELSVSVNMTDSRQRTMLQTAAAAGHFHVVKYLVARGANVNPVDYTGYSPVMIAADHGHIDVVDYLVNHRANLRLTSHNGETLTDIIEKPLAIHQKLARILNLSREADEEVEGEVTKGDQR